MYIIGIDILNRPPIFMARKFPWPHIVYVNLLFYFRRVPSIIEKYLLLWFFESESDFLTAFLRFWYQNCVYGTTRNADGGLLMNPLRKVIKKLWQNLGRTSRLPDPDLCSPYWLYKWELCGCGKNQGFVVIVVQLFHDLLWRFYLVYQCSNHN